MGMQYDALDTCTTNTGPPLGTTQPQACSSRNTPKPRPPPPSARPNITFPTYTCPPTYAAWYCLNGATCFTIKIEESLLYNCE
ncbi:hypothetical protein RUM43_001209 [Polyplax serrata]|uniref:Uncharacterized protein n=1 Tax=Polyplax serrata TaxID=468196 RepID=A0AAN8XPC4_POLSC